MVLSTVALGMLAVFTMTSKHTTEGFSGLSQHGRNAKQLKSGTRERIILHAATLSDTALLPSLAAVESTDGDFAEPSLIEFVPSKDIKCQGDIVLDQSDAMYPFVQMIRGSAGYIADHREEIAVFHIPGELLALEEFPQLMDDIALAWLLGLKIVVVVGCRYDFDCCSLEFTSGYECHNSLRVTDEKLLRDIEEEAGYVRFEVERQLNRCLRIHGGMSPTNEHAPAPNGNVVGGNFYTSKPFGMVRGVDYKSTGYPCHVHVEKIQEALQRNDVVLLSTVGTSRLGDLVNVNGSHLAALVATSLKARKLVYMSTNGIVLRKEGAETTLQDVPVSFAKSLLEHHKVQVHGAGFALFEEASASLDPGAVEMLLHLGWSAWALEQGVTRAHIVNPGDGALLEELYSAKNGVNTCLYHDSEVEELNDDLDDVLDDMHSMMNQDDFSFSDLRT